MSKKLTEADVESKFKKRLVWTIIIGILVICVLWTLNYFSEAKGEFGDKFGIVNSLFSGLAFAGIIITIYMQKHELELQRRELKATTKVFRKQSKIMTNQQNDNTFFNLLENHRQLVHSFTKGETDYDFSGSLTQNNWKSFTKAVSGYEVLHQIAESWKNYFSEYSQSYQNGLINNLALQKYKNPFELINSDPITQTFTRELLHLHDFINRKFKTEDEKNFYRETLYRSLTDQERFIFECMYELFPSERKGILYKPTYYLEHGFIDFNEHKLPEFRIEYKYDHESLEKFKIFVTHYAQVVKSEFIIYQSYFSHQLKIFERVPIEIEETNEHRKGVIYLLKYLERSTLKSWATKPAKFLEAYKFAVHLSIELNNQIFSIVFGIDFSCSERFSPEQNKLTELTNVGIKNLDSILANNMNQLISELNLQSD